MKRPPRVGSGLVLSLACLVGSARGQFERPSRVPNFSFTPLAVSLAYAEDPALQKALKLGPDRVAKLVELKEQWFANLSKVRPADMPDKAVELSQAAAKGLADVLTADQVKRLRQLMLQQLNRNYGAARVLLYDDVADELKLSDEQRTALRPRTAVDTVLTKDQQTAWKALLGEPGESELTPTFPPGSVVDHGPVATLKLELLVQESVRLELDVSAGQAAKVRACYTRLRTPYLEFVAMSLEERRRKKASLNEEADKELRVVLKPDQFERLQQIELQFDSTLRPAALHTTLGLHPNLVQDVGLTKEQLARIARAEAEKEKAIDAALISGEPPDKIRQAIVAAKRETVAKHRAALTLEQRNKLGERLGRPFSGQLRSLGGFGRTSDGRPANIGPQSLTSAAIGLVEQKSVRDELKLNDQQVADLIGLRSEWLQNVVTARVDTAWNDAEAIRKNTIELDRALQQKVEAITTAAGLRRLKQIAIQVVRQGERARFFGGPRLSDYLDVTDTLVLTPDQIDRLAFGASLPSILTEVQKEKWKEMIGAPFTLKLVPSNPSVPALEVLRYPGVKEDIKLTAEQAEKIVKIDHQFREMLPSRIILSGDTEDRYEKYEKAMQQAQDGVREALDENQRKRLRQLRLQFRVGEVGLSSVLCNEVAKDLGLDDKAMERIAQWGEYTAEVRSLMMYHFWLRDISIRDATAAALSEKFETQAHEKQLSLLTEAQRAKLSELFGEAYRRPERREGSGFARPAREVPPGFAPPRIGLFDE